MAVRQVYSCDWCHIDAPTSGSICGDWKTPHDPNGNKMVMCADCYKAMCNVWTATENERIKLRPLKSR